MKQLRRFQIFKISLFSCCLFLLTAGYSQTAVDAYGKLSVQGNKIVDKNGNPVQLQGMSLFWSQWEPDYYNATVVQKLRDDWCTNVIRAAMAVEEGGYLSNPSREEQKVRTVVNAAINLGMYVIIDWHDHNAHSHTNQAVQFFSKMAQEFGQYPNVIYEIYNEPLNVSWSNTIKPYCETVISAIRQHDPDNLIICGTPNWSQDVDIASQNKITSSTNIAYTLHYYAGTHGQFLRNKAQTALNNGIALFVTEFGTVNADGNGGVNTNESNNWFNFMDQHKISHCNWSLCDKAEGSAALQPGTGPNDNWTNRLTTSGNFIKNRYTSNCPTYAVTDCNGVSNGTASIDDCGECTGGNTGKQPNSSCSQDCNGEWGGSAFTDDCGRCVGGNTGLESCDQASYNSNPHLIPGRIELEEYDFGGEGIGYHDSDDINEGGEFRNDGVDIEFAAGATDNYNIGWTAPGEWLEYTVTVQQGGPYKVQFGIASPDGAGSWRLELDGSSLIPSMGAVATGDWQIYSIQESGVFDLQAGQYELRFIVEEGGFNVDYMNFVPMNVLGSANKKSYSSVVFPNPVKDQLNIPNPESKNWNLYNALGEVILSGSEGKVDMSKYPSGIYYISIEGKTESFIKY